MTYQPPSQSAKFITNLNVTLQPARSSQHILGTSSNEESRVEIEVLDDNTLLASVQFVGEPGSQICQTQPIYVDRPLPITLVIWCEDNRVDVGVYDGQKTRVFKHYDSTNIIPAFIKVPDLPASSAFEHPSARLVCQPFIDWRTNRYQKKRKVKPNNRPVPLAEQFTQFQNAIHDVAAHCEGVGYGSRSSLKYLASELRALIYWKEDTGGHDWENYDPLLFRMANRAALALPVFAVRDLQLPPWTTSRKEYQSVRSRMPTFVMEHLDDELMDFQDWLSQIAVIEKPENTAIQPEKRTVKGIISLATIFYGGSHYDPDVPKDLDLLASFSQENQDGLALCLVGIGEAVVRLGEHVIAELEQGKLT